jgi:hypothetical protein
MKRFSGFGGHLISVNTLLGKEEGSYAWLVKPLPGFWPWDLLLFRFIIEYSSLRGFGP